MSCNSSIFGSTNNYIKFLGGDAVAIEGSNTVEKLVLNDLRIPYKQLLKSRIILKAGQVNYLLNHLGLGDNATVLMIRATYNTSSVNAEDNYVVWNYYDDSSRLYEMGQLMILTGNPTHRIKQLYLTNPNTKYAVIMDVMAGVVDDAYSFFEDTINQIGLSFTSLTVESIETHVPNDSLVIWDNNVPRNPLAYIMLSNIASISRTGKLLILDDTSVGRLFLDFVTEYDAQQTHSLINYVLENTSIIIQDLDPLTDSISPVIYFYSNVGNTASGYTISVTGTYSAPVDTSMGTTFSTYLSMGTYSAFTKSQLLNMLVDTVTDNRDGNISISESDIVLYDSLNIASSAIITTETYSINFSVSDIAGNSVDTSTKINIYVI